jgi:hypothetical protein
MRLFIMGLFIIYNGILQYNGIIYSGINIGTSLKILGTAPIDRWWMVIHRGFANDDDIFMRFTG